MSEIGEQDVRAEPPTPREEAQMRLAMCTAQTLRDALGLMLRQGETNAAPLYRRLDAAIGRAQREIADAGSG